MPEGTNIAADVEAVKRAADAQNRPRNAAAPDRDVPSRTDHCYRCPRPDGEPCPQTQVQGCAYLAPSVVRPLVDAEVPDRVPSEVRHRTGCNNPHTLGSQCSHVADGSEGPEYLGYAIHDAWLDPDHPDAPKYAHAEIGHAVDPDPIRIQRGGVRMVDDGHASVGPFAVTDDMRVTRPTGDYARDAAEEAIRLFTGDRNADYGDATDNFQDIADLWTVALRPLLREGAAITAEQVAVCSALIKVARLNNTPNHDDSWVDATAYLALGAGINRRRADTTTTEENDDNAGR